MAEDETAEEENQQNSEQDDKGEDQPEESDKNKESNKKKKPGQLVKKLEDFNEKFKQAKALLDNLIKLYWNPIALLLLVGFALWVLAGDTTFKEIFSFKVDRLSAVAVVFLLAAMVLVYVLDPYRKDGSDILHPRTHATLILLYLTVIAIGLAIQTVTAQTGTATPPFIWMAYFIGTLGAALGALQRLDVSDTDVNLLLENIGKLKKDKSTYVTIVASKAKGQSESQDISINREQGLKFHARLVQQIYISVAIGGILGVFGLIVISSIPGLFKSIWPVLSSNADASNLSDWLKLRPQSTVDYGKAVLLCIVFGYSQRLSRSVLNRLEETADDLLGGGISSGK